MEDEEKQWQTAAEHLLSVSASGAAVAQVLPALDAENSCKLLHYLSNACGGNHFEDSDALAVSLSVKCVLKAINTTVSGCSDRIKARVSRSCVSLCSCCVRILLSSAASVAQCFALRQTDFEHAFDDPTQRIAVGVSADQRVRNRGIIGENIRKFLREDLSEATASSQANILACSIMLSLMREIDNTLLLTAYHFLIRGGNDAACRSLARVQEHDVLYLFFAAAKDVGCRGGDSAAAAAVRLAQGLRKTLGAVEGEMLVATQQQKDAALAAQQSNVSRLLRANKVATAALYSSSSEQYAPLLQRHVIRVLCSMNKVHDAERLAEEWGIQKEVDVHIMLKECNFGPAAGMGSSAEGFLQLPDSVRIVTLYDASDAQQTAEVAAVLGMEEGFSGECNLPYVAIDVEWPCAAWDGSGRASIMQVATSIGCVIFDLNGICCNNISAKAFNDMITRLLLSPICTKLFYGCDQDMKKLHSSWPGVDAFRVGACRCLELNQLAAAVRVDLRNKSLSDVCFAILGQPLNKKQRLSNWALRPLTSEQIAYAVLDVYAPILIFETLRKSRHDSNAVLTAAAGCEWYESLCFDLPAANILVLKDVPMPCMPSIVQAPTDTDLVLETTAAVTDAICIPSHASLHHASIPEADALPLESAAVNSLNVGFDIMNPHETLEPTDSFICLGRSEVVAALENSKKADFTYELTSVPNDVVGDMWGAASKFEVFDKIQLHADVVGMTRQQVLKTLCILVKTAGTTMRRFAVVMIGDMFLDMAKVASAVGCCRKHVQLAPALHVLRLFGYRIGSVPPIGFLPAERDGMGVRVLMDSNVSNLGPDCCVLVGGGSADTVLKISVANLLHAISCENSKSDMTDVATVHDLCRSNHSPGIATPQLTLLNAGDASEAASALRLACDPSVARAGKWLRAMGVDCTLVDSPSVDAIQAMLTEGRVFLSADRKLVDKREFQNSPVVLVLETDAKDQLLEIVRHFKIVYNPERFLVRCVFCNTEAFEELSPEAAKIADTHGSIPARVFTQVPSFQMCSGCRRIFWRGPKFKNTEEYLLDILRQ